MQTLGLLLTRRIEEIGLNPLDFVATDYATLIWGLDPLQDAGPLLEMAALKDGLEQWLAGNAVMQFNASGRDRLSLRFPLCFTDQCLSNMAWMGISLSWRVFL